MKMTKIEKKFVNRKKHAQGNIRVLERIFTRINIDNIKNVLEIGCGVGHLAAYLNKNYEMNITGTDLDEEQIKLAKKFHDISDTLSFYQANATHLPFEDEQFNMLLSFKVLHHIPDWERALNEINRVLKPNGIYIVNDLTGSSWLVAVLKLFMKKNRIFTTIQVADFLQNKKFKILYEEGPKGFIIKHFSMVFQKYSL